ncbi:TPA: hypothetical protein OVP63_002727 [Staphylococcus aureus]|nr:hypothetical protein [Staphylococcus aureus]HCV1732428.1 hypothetical protein [Staphylococcus aureus]HCV7048142.1 hypothetical protein [Staphylococcus aureus]
MPPTSRRAGTNERKRMMWLAKPMLAKPKWHNCEMRKFLTSKAKMIATSVAIGAGFKLD